MLCAIDYGSDNFHLIDFDFKLSFCNLDILQMKLCFPNFLLMWNLHIIIACPENKTEGRYFNLTRLKVNINSLFLEQFYYEFNQITNFKLYKNQFQNHVLEQILLLIKTILVGKVTISLLATIMIQTHLTCIQSLTSIYPIPLLA